MKNYSLGILFGLTLGMIPAHAIILFGLDNSANQTDPGTGVPFESVARLSNGSGTYGGSGIYLGNGYILTAHHVGPFSSVTFDGITSYSHDGVAPTQIGTTDMKIFRLTSMPSVAAVQLYTGSSELSGSGTLVGWGVGRDPATPLDTAVVPWGDNSTSEKRWGLNTPMGVYDDFRTGIHTFDILYSTLGASGAVPPGLGDSEAAATLLDSGAGLFQFLDSTWYLTGLATTLTISSPGLTSTFGKDVTAVLTPAVFPDTDTEIALFEDAGDINIFARVGSYSGDINAMIPEPSAMLLTSPALLLLLRRRRCRTRH